MKHLMPLLLSILISCSPSWGNITYPRYVDEHTIPTIITSASNGSINLTCQVQELNPALVWVECNFNNHSKHVDNVCIRVRFFDKTTADEIAESRKVCSGPLQPNEKFVNYAAFYKENRVALQKCGEMLSSCDMLTGS